jgi:hypothetical protein
MFFVGVEQGAQTRGGQHHIGGRSDDDKSLASALGHVHQRAAPGDHNLTLEVRHRHDADQGVRADALDLEKLTPRIPRVKRGSIAGQLATFPREGAPRDSAGAAFDPAEPRRFSSAPSCM